MRDIKSSVYKTERKKEIKQGKKITVNLNDASYYDKIVANNYLKTDMLSRISRNNFKSTSFEDKNKKIDAIKFTNYEKVNKKNCTLKGLENQYTKKKKNHITDFWKTEKFELLKKKKKKKKK